MRVNPNLQSALLSGLDRVSEKQQRTLKQLASGVRIQTPADDPAGAAALIQIQAEESATQQNMRNINALQAQMQAADSTMNSVVLALRRALMLGVEGATATLSESDRTAVSNELSGIKDQLLELSNSSLQGVYLFAGTATDKSPFVADGSSVSGISYRGNDHYSQVEVGQNYWVRSNVPGSSIFGDGTNGVFKAVSDLITAVQNNTGVDAATAAVEAVGKQVSAARVQYGNTMNQLSSDEAVANGLHLQLQQQINSLASVDVAEAASDLVTIETSREALFSVIAKTNGVSLFDYLR